MLLRFGVSNFRSIKEYQEFSLVASALKENGPNLISAGEFDQKVLPGAAIYGANASGKSNFLKAVAFMHGGIMTSHAKGSATGGIPREPFQLDPKMREEPSRFDCDMIIDHVRYHYGFVVDDHRVVEEWLYAFPRQHRQVWFHRKHGEKEPFYFGKQLKGRNKVIESLTRENSLFLSAAAQNNHEQLSAIYGYFKSKFVFRLGLGKLSIARMERYLNDEAMKGKIVDFLRNADTGIAEAKIEKVELSDQTKPFLAELETLFKKAVNEEFELPMEDLTKSLSFGHLSKTGDFVFLPLDSESRGTLHLLSMLGPVFNALSKGKVLFIDELDTSMHPLLSRKLIALFGSAISNRAGGQIIFSTHDTNLLCGGVLRRDQIWFTEKNLEGATVLYPLTDIRTRRTDNIEKGYLQGRFGGIPFLGDLDDLFRARTN